MKINVLQVLDEMDKFRRTQWVGAHGPKPKTKGGYTMNKAYMNKALKHIEENKCNMLAAYSQNVLVVSEADRWDYALPENYTLYHGGFIFANEEPHRGKPLVNLNGLALYLFYAFQPWELSTGEKEKLLLFDRHGSKYTFIVQSDPSAVANGNRSYFDFVDHIKAYSE